MIAKPFWMSVLGAVSFVLSACSSSPTTSSTADLTDAAPTASQPQAGADTPSTPSKAAATPSPVQLEPAPQDESEPLPETPHNALSDAPFQAAKPTFASPQQARLYQDSLYRLLLGELSIAKGDYQVSAEQFLQVARLSRQADIAEQATRVALFDKNMANVEAAALLWLELAPNNLEARQVLTVALLRQNKANAAAQQIEMILDQEGSSIGSSSDTLVGLLKQTGNQETALQVLDDLVKRRPQDTHLLYLYARLLIGAEQIPAATLQLERLLAANPGHEEAVPLYVRLLHQQDETDKVLAFLRKQLELFPHQDDWRLMYARLLLSAEQDAAAQAQFTTLLARKPDDTELLYTLGLLNLQNEQLEPAKSYFQQLLKLAKDNEQRNSARYFLGQTAEQAKQMAEALDWYRKIDEGQHYFNANVRMVMMHLDAKNFAQAQAQFREIVPGTPDEEFKLLQLEAEIYSRQQRLADAFAVYQRGLDRDPDNIDLLYMQGMLAEKQGKLDVLEANFRHILKVEPDNIDTLNALGYTLADRTNRYQEALELIQRAYQARPNAHYILDSMGWIMYRLQRYDEAIEFLRKALTVQEDPEIAAHLGEVLWQAGKADEARELWTAMKAKFPDDELLQKTMQKFLQN